MGVSSCALQELIGKRETSWTPSPVFEAKATLGEFTSLLGFFLVPIWGYFLEIERS